MQTANRVSIEKLSTTTRTYTPIVLLTHDLRFTCDLVNHRQLKLAERLAADHEVPLEIRVDEADLPKPE